MHTVVLWEDGFPFVDTVACTREHLGSIKKRGDQVTFVGVDGLAEALRDTSVVLVTPYGSAFPKAAWSAMHDFLNRGGSWVNIGGSPVSRPVRKNSDGSWHVEVSQTGYSKELGIRQAFPIDLDGDEQYFRTSDLATLSSYPVSNRRSSRVWSLQVRFTDNKDYPGEGGSSGTRDAILTTLLRLSRNKRNIAAPIVMIDRLRGPFAGGRWILVNAELNDPIPADWLYEMCRLAARGPIELEVRPSFACYYPGEQPALSIRLKSHRWEGNVTCTVRVQRRGEEATVLAHGALALSVSPLYRHIPLPINSTQPGYYWVTCSVESFKPAFTENCTTGFWIYDEELLTSGKPLTVNRDYFERDGEPYPVMGTTYMAGDVSRKFLFEPNCTVWDRDFQAMKEAGVNMVRTGFWTGWRRVMLDPGAVDEGVLRAFTAFLLTARKYDIPVIFNFFAFWPEEWGGSNPYLDPRAVEAQKELVAAFAHRFAKVDDLIWDFINEPSVSSPARVWSTRPNYDKFERAAWAKWLEERAADFSEDEKQAANPADVWRERWRLTPNAPLDLPALEDFQDRHIFQGTHPIRVLDYKLFAQEMFNRWVKELTSAIRSNGNPQQLITVGQDEGGTGDRPNPHFYADVVDITTNHSWWQNDDLLWDSVMTKTPNKPNLIQETGIMFVENVDGGYRRTPEECANLLARKLVLSFAAGGAGAIQWLWNTNYYMDDDNEVGIGFLRADGTEKPELQVFREIAKFFWENRHKMVGRKLEEVCIVVPHSNMFSVRNFADIATRRAVRTLEYGLGVPTRTVSEYRIQDIGDPKLIVLPSPHVLTQACWETLLEKVEAGATLLVTGTIDRDEYWRAAPRLNALDPDHATEIRPVSQTEMVTYDPKRTNVGIGFRGDTYQKADKAAYHDTTELNMRRIPHGKGQIYHYPVPVEIAQASDLLLAYQDIVHEAFERDTTPLDDSPAGVLIRRVEFAEYVLYLMLNEAGSEWSLKKNIQRLVGGEAAEAMAILPGQVAVSFRKRGGTEAGAVYRQRGRVLKTPV